MELEVFAVKDFSSLVLRVGEFLKGLLRFRELFVLLGSCEIIDVSLLASLIVLWEYFVERGVVVRVELYSDDRFYDLTQVLKMLVFSFKCSRSDFDFIEQLGDKPSSLGRLASVYGLKLSTLSKKIHKLSRAGVVTVLSRKPLKFQRDCSYKILSLKYY
ncbi:MAG TPA: hypothetical protein ENF80_05430 [Thermofilum sp.]|nr:hypothetical protein [Thermofilum sp.]